MQQRIISLVPSQTELLYDLGLEEEVVGITKFCIHPESWFRNKTRVGGTKTIDIEKIRSLQPTLILANKEENVKEQVEALQEFSEVYVSDISNLEDALQMIKHVGLLVGKPGKAETIAATIEASFKELKLDIAHHSKTIKTAYLIWRNPYMAAGGDTFITDLMSRCGFSNIFSHINRYPEVTIEMLQQAGCELLLLSSEPYPFKQKHIDEIAGSLPDCKIMLVDGEMFSWYGSRLLYAADYFKQLRKEIL